MVKAGEVDTQVIDRKMREVIQSVCPTAEVDYIAFTEFDTLRPVADVRKGVVCSLAVRVHEVRLIDNLRF
jgi:pantoate--beta-alanine ligase